MVRSTAPTKKVSKILGGMGATVKHKRSTIAKIGNTAFNVSDNFSANFSLNLVPDNNADVPFKKYTNS